MKSIIIGLSILFLSSTGVYAHPGRTASDGCHYCRTNCDKWGEAWDQRHCHGAAAPISTPTPTPTIIKTPTSTKKPTATPTKIVTTPTFSPTPTSVQTEQPQPEVLGDEDASTKSNPDVPKEEKTTNSNGVAWLMVLGTASLVGYQYQKQRRQS